ncbi:amino acid adenylation domain-containing protein [Kribbella sp. NPDC004536]|uniref:amino acid adenylation domain-containing protein n=1 Tax=Kribbella sp. NPDC004536 TaxID=3364106 RepID=UPI0036A63127
MSEILDLAPEPIAIVGIGCRLPGGANTPERFWRLLLDSTDTVGEIPQDRWDVDAFYHPDPDRAGKMYTRRGSFLDDVYMFDADFFKISPREAAWIDPQHRMLLELTWEALEDGWLAPGHLAGSDTGIFVGICSTDYRTVRRQDLNSIDAYTNTGAAISIAANRISHAFDFHGPSVAVDTACSSALTAVHLACESVRRRECHVAVAGGINLMFDPTTTIGFSRASMLSPTGRCSSFDAAADGFVRAEGAGLVVLKPLQAALDDGDPIYAVIRASGLNQDGRTSGIALPNGDAQRALLQSVYADAGIDPTTVQYVEAHGTGTRAGDPIECAALGAVFGGGRADGDYLRIGSVKTNVGHTEAASGITGLIKAALALKHSHIPANLHFKTPNPDIPFDDLRLRVQTGPESWPASELPKRAGVNSFGFGGTSAHVVLEEAPVLAGTATTGAAVPPAAPRILPLSARTPQAVRDYARAYLSALEDASVTDICYAASRRRENHPYRAAIVGVSPADIEDGLRAFSAGATPSGVIVGSQPVADESGPVFVFSGNGSQWWGMGRQLLAADPLFEKAVAECDQLIQDRTGWSVLAELSSTESASRMDRTDIAQPCLFALQVGLVARLRAWGIEPTAVAGHSVGEVAAAYTAGILTLPQAVEVIVHRSRAQERTAGRGAMAAVGISAADAEEVLAAYGQQVCIAAVNSPSSVTIAGDREAVEDIVAGCVQRQRFAKVLPLNYAFHSHQMDPIRDELVAALSELRPSAGSIPFVSTVAGAVIEGNRLDADYWWRNIRRPVAFAAAVNALTADGHSTFVEVGPHPVLRSYMSECAGTADGTATVLTTLRRDADDTATLAMLLGSLFVAGSLSSLGEVNRSGTSVNLPGYPWQRERHYKELGRGGSLAGPSVHPLLGSAVNSARAEFENNLDLALLPYLNDHRVQGDTPVFPMAGYIEMALASVDGDHSGSVAIDDLVINKAFVLPASAAVPVRFARSSPDGSFEIHTEADGSWDLISAGRVRAWQAPSGVKPIDITDIRGRLDRRLDRTAHYEFATRHELHYGPVFQSVECVWTGQDESLGEVKIDDSWSGQGYVFHPALLDGCLQSILPCLFTGAPGEPVSYLPVGFDRLRLYQRPEARVYCHARITKRRAKVLWADALIANADGVVVAEIKGIALRAMSGTSGGFGETDDVYEQMWRPAARSPKHRTRNADHLPDPAELSAVARENAAELIEHLGRETYCEEVSPALEELATAYVRSAFVRLGWVFAVGDSLTAEAICDRLGIVEEHQRLTAHFLRMLADDGFLRRDGRQWVVQEELAACDPAAMWADLAARFPGSHANLELLARCGENLADVLSGRLDPLGLIFGESAGATVDHLYESDMVTRFYNATIQGVVSTIANRLPTDRSLRIIEIGAGTGGTTSQLVDHLPADRTDYVFTDVSEAFFEKASHRLHAYPFVSFAPLDIEKNPVSQGFDEHSFDVVVASNVLHATTDICWTLEQVRRLLAPGGILIVAEVVKPLRYLFTIFGLLRGFWLFLDEDIRPEHTLLSEDRWIQVLTDMGFEQATAIDEGIGEPGTAVLLARGPLPDVDRPEIDDRSTRRCWLMLTDDGGAVATVADDLTSWGDRVITVAKGPCFEQLAANRFTLRPGDAEDLGKLLTALESASITDVVQAWPLDSDAPSATGLRQARMLALSTIQLAVRLAGKIDVPRLWLVTGGAYAVAPGHERPMVTAGPVAGLHRVIVNEYPELRCTLVDVSSPQPMTGESRYADEEIRELGMELRTNEAGPDALREDEIALRGFERFVSRLVRGATPVREMPAFRAGIATPGLLDTLELAPLRRRAPGAGEVEIEVRAAGLNFKDVMNAMGLLPPESVELGFASGLALGGECAGRVVAVGAGVVDVSVGDDVIALGSHSLSSHMTTSANLVVRKPADITFEEAATLLVTFVTCHYGLRQLANLQPGDRVLIHHGTGGVGLSALQIAQHAGAEVFATAGTEEKREYLRRLGVKHVMDSRSLTFADEIMTATRGEGVDVVLNSLAGDGMQESLRVLSRFGRFVEIGKQDFLANNRLAMKPFDRCISFFAVDVDQMLLHDPATIRCVLREVAELLDAGVYRPLPYRAYPVGQLVHAFRYMQQSRHIGKVVVSLREGCGTSLARRTRRLPAGTLTLRSDAAYLIAGGLSGFGLAAAQWLADRGARHLLLLSRSGTSSTDESAALAELVAAGVEVIVQRADIADPADVREALGALAGRGLPVAGVINSAMVLDDALLADVDEARLDLVMRPKVDGSWNLHEQTLHEPLDFFVMFSSMTSTFGNPGQGNYVAANAFLDSLASYRRSLGLPALTVNWGPIGEVGYVARHGEQAEMGVLRGTRRLDPPYALDIMGQLIQFGTVQAAVAHIDWRQAREKWPVISARWAGLLPESSDDSAEPGTGAAILQQVRLVSPDERLAVINAWLIECVGRVLGSAPGNIEPERSISDLGLDSLMATELRVRIQREAGVDVPVVQLLRFNRLLDLSGHVANALEADLDGLEAGAPTPADERRTEVAEHMDESGAETDNELAADLQAWLCSAWMDVIGIPSVDPTDDFFVLGGSSIQAMLLSNRIQASLDVALPHDVLFTARTVVQLCEYLAKHHPDALAAWKRGASGDAGLLQPDPSGYPVELSPGQQRVWFLDRLHAGSPFHNLVRASRLRGRLDLEALATAVRDLAIRHRILTTHISGDFDEPRLVHNKGLLRPMTVHHVADEGRTLADVLEAVRAEAAVPFDLPNEAPFRLNVYRLAEDDHVLCLVFHHIAVDDWSVRTVISDLGSLYAAANESVPGPDPVPALATDYPAYVRGVLESVDQGRRAAELEYWTRELAGLPSRFGLAAGSGDVTDHAPLREEVRLGGDLSTALRDLCTDVGVTPFVAVAALSQLLLQRWTGNDDAVIGYPTNGRNRREYEPMVGYFLNTLVLRTDLSASPSFRDVLRHNQAKVREGLEHQGVPYQDVVEAVRRRSGGGLHQPLFEVLVNPQLDTALSWPVAHLELTWLQVSEPVARVPLTVYLREDGNELTLELVAQAAVLSKNALRAMSAQLLLLARSAVGAPDVAVEDHSLVTDEGPWLARKAGADLRPTEYPTVGEVIAEQASTRPTAMAVECGADGWTYADLHRAAETIASELRARGAQHKVVAVRGTRSFGAVAAMYAVWLADGILFTIDPTAPVARQLAGLDETSAAWILDLEGQLLPGWSSFTLDIDPRTAVPGTTVASATVRPEASTHPDGAAYLFLTSGTTGRPRAVRGTHQGLAHFLAWQRSEFAIGPGDRAAQLTGPSFDVVLRDVFAPLVSGATLCVPDRSLSPDEVLGWLVTSGITITNAVPTLATAWLSSQTPELVSRHMRTIFLAGEACRPELVRQLRNRFPAAEIVNLYGPTETTLAKCFYRVPVHTAAVQLPVGQPMPGSEIFVVARDGRQCGPYELGEVVIRTPYRTSGYLNDDALTAARFRPNPDSNRPDDLLYFSGDRGRLDADGNLVLLGRLDDQIKIRGTRIEPVEVQAALQTCPGVGSCAVIGVEDIAGAHLVAYVVPDFGGSVTRRELTSHLAKLLPVAMVPSRFIMLEQLPFTSNGKLDRAVLRDIAAEVEDWHDSTAAADSEPVTPVEEVLVEIWSRVLGVHEVSRQDNFFALGGHSLMAMQLVSRVRDRLGVELALADVFETPTLATLAAKITSPGVQPAEPPITPRAAR